MRVGFIVAEYNPLHNGHVKHIQKTKEELGCDAIVAIMSGDIVQRGELAIKDKYERAEWAIKAGCDMVVELPVEYVLGSAQIFANGAIKVIDYFDCEKYISFGSECGSIYVLEKINEMMATKENQDYIKEFMESGNTYAKANSLALEKYLENHGIDKSIADVIKEPNNILGIEYIKAINGLAITPHTIKREGSYNNSDDPENPSATTIREQIYNGGEVFSKVPMHVFNSLIHVQDNSEKLFSIIKYELSRKDNLDKIFGMNEGLHNRFLSFLSSSSTYEEFMQNVKTKRYTMTSLSRSLMCALLDNTYTFNEVMDLDIEYINVLAIKSSQRKLLSIIENNLVTKPSELEKLKQDKKIDAHLDEKAANLFKAINYNYDSHMRIVD